MLIAAAKLGAGDAAGLNEDAKSAADVNKDGSINAKDASVILRYAAAIGAGKKVSITDYTSETPAPTDPVIVGERVTTAQTEQAKQTVTQTV